MDKKFYEANNKFSFVSSFVFREPDDTDEKVAQYLLFLLSFKIPLQLFIIKEHEELIRNILSDCYQDNQNISIHVIDVNDTWIRRELSNHQMNKNDNDELCCIYSKDEEESAILKNCEVDERTRKGEEELCIQLPKNRNIIKDNFHFLLSGHTKHEFLELAIAENKWNSTHFAWLDFNISKIVHNKKGICEFFNWLNVLIDKKPFLTIPGCWTKWEKSKITDITDAVHWRFCGGFLMGDARSVKEFCELYREKLPGFLKEYNKLVWDFNFWAWMETIYETRWKALWYRGNHDDSIFLCSADNFTRRLENILVKKEYDYPKIETYYPTSASYCYYQGKHLLNTRYVNYWIYPNGCYLFNSGKRLIENKNILSELEESTMNPNYYKEVSENLIEYPITQDTISIGLEDLRIYEFDGKMKYIAATTGYSPNGKSRMIAGDYDIEEGKILSGKIIQPPNKESWCEKNWIPFIKNNKEYFIYKWYPLEIGHVDYEKGEFIMDYNIPVSFPLFSKVKGSSIFYDVSDSQMDGFLGVVHFSEDHETRHYYHMLILLDKETMEIKNYSETFCFEKLGIEYCICFLTTKKEDTDGSQYTFWISRHDRDPAMIQVDSSEIKWMYS